MVASQSKPRGLAREEPLAVGLMPINSNDWEYGLWLDYCYNRFFDVLAVDTVGLSA
jgi:hypothetical protein